ncbi:MAG: DUF885 domain-containing protein [Polyangiaceae bacterium]|nr:DUF885 domain-containing protein [Polyangiaceae bacterium]
MHGRGAGKPGRVRHGPLALVLLLTACPPDAPEASRSALPSASGAAPVPSASTASSGAAVTAPSERSLDQRFTELSAEFLEGYLTLQPVRATEAGDHRFDDRWPDLSEAGDEKLRAFIKVTRDKLAPLELASASAQTRVDAAMLTNQLDLMTLSLDELKPLELDPLVYTGAIGDGLDPLVTRSFGTPEERARALKARLDGVPAVVAAAKSRLKRPPKVHTETAIAQARGLVSFCRESFPVLTSAVPSEKGAIEAAAKKAGDALAELLEHLEKEVLPRSDGDFRLGRARFEKKLRLVLDDDVDVEAQAGEAMALLKTTQTEMVESARELWPALFKDRPFAEPKSDEERRVLVQTVLAKLADDRSTDATIVKDATATLEAATAFVKERDLVRVPDEPCQIIEMPEYRRGVAIAYCDAAGPLEPKPETFYAISPTPQGWSPKRVESYYREYNRGMLHDLTVHEAMPGHFLQLMHNNRFPSKLRAVFSHGAFVEGWAVYAEWLMAKHGFGGARVRMQRQKMALRMAANAVLDFGVHAKGMSEKEALGLMMNEAFQEEGEAVGKWKRATLTSAQLTTYYYGFTRMMALRSVHERKAGFSERAYHDRLLSFGSPSPRHLPGLLDGAP